jgi:hypothetical protein
MKTQSIAWNPPPLLFAAEATGLHEWVAFY